jgi:hypothetical protein
MSFGRLRSNLNPLRHNDPPRAWWDVFLWVPVGFATTRLVGDTLPPLAMAVMAVLLAAAHHFGPAVVASIAGAGGLIASGAQVWDAGDCQKMIGDIGVVVVVVFGSIFVVSSFVRLIGAVSLLEMSRHLLIATASIEISLFAVAPRGKPLIDADQVLAPALLLAVLMVVSQIGLIDRMELGFLSLGVMLVPVEFSLATRDHNVCGPGGWGPFVGTVVFALASYYFSLSRPVHKEPVAEGHGRRHEPGSHHGNRGDIQPDRVGSWVDQTPDTGVWVDDAPDLGPWVDQTPETGIWRDMYYEDEHPGARPRPGLGPDPYPEPDPDDEDNTYE